MKGTGGRWTHTLKIEGFSFYWRDSLSKNGGFWRWRQAWSSADAARWCLCSIWTPWHHFTAELWGLAAVLNMIKEYRRKQKWNAFTFRSNCLKHKQAKQIPGKKKRKASKLTVPLSPALICWLQIGLRRKVQTFPGKMVNTLHSDEEKGTQDKESKEESILAMLGIIGTILNLLVIIFVYIYTTLWLLPTCRLIAAHLDVSMGTALEKSSLTGGGLESSLWDGREAPTRHRFRWLRPPETGGLLSSAQVDSSRIRLRLWLPHVHGDGHLESCRRTAPSRFSDGIISFTDSVPATRASYQLFPTFLCQCTYLYRI